MEYSVKELYDAYVAFVQRSNQEVHAATGLSPAEMESQWGRAMPRLEFENMWRRVSRDPLLKQFWIEQLMGTGSDLKNAIHAAMNSVFGRSPQGADH